VDVVSAEITYGLERIAMYVQGVDSIFDIEWTKGVKWGDVYREFEYEFSVYNYEEANLELHLRLFDEFEREAHRLLDKGLLFPGYDFVIKLSHEFNLLDARGALSVSERAAYIARVRKAAKKAALLYLKKQEGVEE